MTSTADIRLRALEPEDLELMYRIENDARFWRHGTTTVPYSRYALHEYLANSHNDIFADGQVRLVIERVATTEVATTEGTTEITPIGFADLVNFDAIHLRAEIGLLMPASCTCTKSTPSSPPQTNQPCNSLRILPSRHQRRCMTGFVRTRDSQTLSSGSFIYLPRELPRELP